MSNVGRCLMQHLGEKSPIAAYKSEMAEDVADLVAGGMDKDAAWVQVIDAKLLNLTAEKSRIEQSVADAYGKTAAGKVALTPATSGAVEAAPADPAKRLGMVMRQAGWEIDYIDLDLTAEQPKADIRITRGDGRFVVAKVDGQGRAMMETFQRTRSLGIDQKNRQARLAPQIDDQFLGRQKFEGARSMLRGMVTYLADNATDPIALADMKAAWASVMSGPAMRNTAALAAPEQAAQEAPAPVAPVKTYPLAPAGTRYEETDKPITMMSPDAFLAAVRPLEIDDASRDNIDELKRHIQSGKTLDPLHIRADGKEDGRHRAVAAKELGIKQVPVVDERAAAPVAEAVAEPVKAAPEKKGVQNFGEALPPSRRSGRASLDKSLTDDELYAKPLSEIWPASEIDAIEDPFAAAVAHAARAEIPSKPRKGYKLDRWVESVKMLRGLAQFITGERAIQFTRDEFIAKVPKTYAMEGFMSKVALLEAIDRANWKRVGNVRESPQAFDYVDGKQVLDPMVSIDIDDKHHWLRGSGSVADHIDAVNALLGVEPQDKKMQFEVRGSGNSFGINKKGDSEYRRLKTFTTAAEASAYRRDNYADLVAAWEAVKERDNVTERDLRSDENKDRIGPDYRDGRDITGDEFDKQFGFKGGEFGKWVSQGKGAQERQWMLNRAYDALMDLAGIVGVPPRALSLDGSLGMAFGSRGTGWASAHFEPSNLVINLTKTRGAGALAHEWFHALDNYFARKRGGETAFTGNQLDYRKNNYVTYKPEPMMVRKDGRGTQFRKAELERRRLTVPGTPYYAAENWQPDPAHPQGVRPEVEERFADLVKALDEAPMTKRAAMIDESTEGYWSRIIERAARSFESYVLFRMQEKGRSNDYLANVTKFQDFVRDKGRYPYPTPDEIKPVADAFDALFDTIQTRTDDAGNVTMFSRASEAGSDIAAAWKTLAENDDLFAFPKSDAADLADIAAEAVPGLTVEPADSLPSNVQAAWYVYPPNKPATLENRGYVIHYKDGKVEVNVANFKEGDAGSQVYAVAGNYAFNNGLEFTGDRYGITPVATQRRLENMISLALKFGTTDFISPHPDMLAALGLQWTSGDSDANLQSMLVASYENAVAKSPALKDVIYDPRTGKLQSQSLGVELTDRDTARLIEGARASGLPIGRRTLSRLGITQAVAESKAGPARRRLLEGIGQRARGPVESLGLLKDALYSRNRATGIPLRDARAVAAKIRLALPKAPPIIIHESVDKAPAALLDDIRAAGAMNVVEAALHAGEIHVFPQHMASIERMEFVVAHHEVRHHGLRAILGGNYKPILLMMRESNPALKAAAQEQMEAYPDLDTVQSVDEALADMPLAELEKLTGFGKLVAAIRQWLRMTAFRLRKAGLGAVADAINPKDWTDNDVAAFVLRAELVSRDGGAEYAAPGTVFQRVWHGTPHRGIEKFSTDNIGTGEGAQSFGYGLYFASKREIAEHYRAGLSRSDFAYADADAKATMKLLTNFDDFVWDTINRMSIENNADPQATAKALRAYAARFSGGRAAINGAAKLMEEGRMSPTPAGQLYEVEIPEDSEYLLWDKPLSEQPPKVRAALESTFTESEKRRIAAWKKPAWALNPGEDPDIKYEDSVKGGSIYSSLATEVDSWKDASNKLLSLGVRGIKYLDGTSRKEGEGSFNYVLFSGDDATITSTAFSRAPAQPRDEGGRFSREAPAWISSGNAALQAAAGKISTYAPEKPIAEKAREMASGWKEKLVQGIFDAYAPLKGLSMDAYIAARMTKAADGAFEGLLMYGKPVMGADGGITGDLDGKGFLGTMRELNGEHDRFLMWVAGNRAARLLADGKENLFKPDEIAAMQALNQGDMADGSSRTEAFKKALADFNVYSKSVLDVAEKSGLIDGDSRKMWEHDFYVPFYRVNDEAEISGPSKIKGLVRQKAFERLKGGKEPLGDLMDNTLRNWSHLLSASLSNVAASKSLLAAERAGIAIEAKEADAKEIAKATGKKGHAVYFMDQGLQRWFVVEDAGVLAAVSALEAPALNGLPLQLMGKFKKYLTVGVTIAPAFKIRNLIRDTLAAPAANEMSYNIAQNLAQGWKGTNTKTSGYAQMLFSGGLMKFGTYLEGDRAENVKRLIAQGVDKSTILDNPNKVRAALGAGWDWWQDFGDRMENVNRTALYEQLMARGMSQREAAFRARDMMDFSLQGAWAGMRTLNAVIPFLNARAQGLYKLGRAAKEDPKRMGYMVGAVSLASIALLLAYQDDDDWKAREDWDRDGFWWIKIGSTAFRIPKPFELGAMGTIAERSVELVISDEMTGARFAERMKQMVTGTFAINPVPQMFKPMLDLYANKDSFTGRQIETLGMERLSKPERYAPNTSTFARVVGSAGDVTGVSPVQVDHMIRAYFGWLGVQAATTVDVITSPLTDTVRPASTLADWSGGFVKDLPSAQSRYLEQFYEQAKTTSEAMADLKRAREAGDLEKAAEIMEDRASDLSKYRLYQKAERQIGELNKRIRVIRYSTSIPSDEKRVRLDDLANQRARLAELVSARALALQ